MSWIFRKLFDTTEQKRRPFLYLRAALGLEMNSTMRALFGLVGLAIFFSFPLLIDAEENPETSTELGFVDLFNGKDLTNWVDVNTSPETWTVKDGLLVCTGKPIGVMRSTKQYENFILVVEWRHMEAGGNSGVFLWSDAKPTGRLPKGMEVQMLELDWPNIHTKKDGSPNHPGYVSGELFGAGGMKAVPENPRGSRSMSHEMRCKGKGEWNRYVVVAVDGAVKLSINGKFVNGIREADLRKGYLCMESEGAEIHFRKIQIMELPSGRAADLGLDLDSEKKSEP